MQFLYCRFLGFLHTAYMKQNPESNTCQTIPLLVAALGLIEQHSRSRYLAETTAEGSLLVPAEEIAIEIYSADRLSEFDAAEADLSQ